jgi:NAD(P)H-hydrate epimerase
MARFETESGRPVPAVTADEMAEVDRVAVEDVDLGLLQMMENAGRTLAGLARELTDGPVVVLAGPGGNGGGGLCAARHLANHGRVVRVVLDRVAAELGDAAARQRRILAAADVDVAADSSLGEAGLVVDALLGYGLDGAPRRRTRSLVAAANDHPAPVLSLDIPSGVDATTGDRPGRAVEATTVLTLALPKTGLAAAGDAAEGRLWLADLGIPRGVYDRVGVDHRQPFDGRSRVRLRPV